MNPLDLARRGWIYVELLTSEADLFSAGPLAQTFGTGMRFDLVPRDDFCPLTDLDADKFLRSLQ